MDSDLHLKFILLLWHEFIWQLRPNAFYFIIDVFQNRKIYISDNSRSAIEEVEGYLKLHQITLTNSFTTKPYLNLSILK